MFKLCKWVCGTTQTNILLIHMSRKFNRLMCAHWLDYFLHLYQSSFLVLLMSQPSNIDMLFNLSTHILISEWPYQNTLHPKLLSSLCSDFSYFTSLSKLLVCLSSQISPTSVTTYTWRMPRSLLWINCKKVRLSRFQIYTFQH